MRASHKTRKVMNGSVACGILHESTEHGTSEFERLVISNRQFDAFGFRPRADHGYRLRMAGFRNKENVGFRLAQVVAHVHGFGRCGSFVQQRGIGRIQPGQVRNNCLEI
jgi:hypothetical protein